MIILAIGQTPDLSLVPKDMQITGNNTIQVDPITLETTLPSMFAGSDVLSEAITVEKGGDIR